MAVKASSTITISCYRDTSSITRYYKLQSSTLATPSKPTTNPPSGWDDTEPAYTNGSTNTLYFCELTEFSDGTYSYSEVSKSSSYEAAKSAYNKAIEAAKTATNFLSYDSINGLLIGNKTNGSWSGYRSQILPSAFNILSSNGDIMSSFGTITTIGQTSGKHTLINNDSFNIKDGSKLLASYSDTINLYNDEREALIIEKSNFIESYANTNGANHAYYHYVEIASTSTVVNITISKSVTSSTLFMVHVHYTGSNIEDIAKNRYILFYPSVTASKFTFKWDPTTPAYVMINGSLKQSCFHCDSNATTDMTINGSLWINNTGDINGLVPGMPPLAIGTREGSRLELDYNEVMAMNNNSPAHLYLNMEGGNVSVNNNCNFGTLINGGSISFKCRSLSEDKWFDTISTIYSNNKLILNIGSDYSSSEYDTITEVSGNEIQLKVLGSSDICRFMSNSNSEFMIADKNGRSVFIPYTAAGNVAIGYGGYSAGANSTNIYGNAIKIFSKDNTYVDRLRLDTNGQGITGLDNSGDVVNMLFVGSSNILNVGGGSLLPQYIHVSSKLRTRLSTTNGSVQLADGEGSATYDGYFHPTTDNKISCGKTTNRWTRVYSANSSISTSDKRQKKSIRPLDNRKHNEVNLYSELFDKLKPCEYKFIEGEQRVNFGLIAQDVLNAMKELGIEEDALDLVHHDVETVVESKVEIDPETGEEKVIEIEKEVESFGLAYENLIALLINEVQHLKKNLKY